MRSPERCELPEGVHDNSTSNIKPLHDPHMVINIHKYRINKPLDNTKNQQNHDKSDR